jgi:hypothetical protein
LYKSRLALTDLLIPTPAVVADNAIAIDALTIWLRLMLFGLRKMYSLS